MFQAKVLHVRLLIEQVYDNSKKNCVLIGAYVLIRMNIVTLLLVIFSGRPVIHPR